PLKTSSLFFDTLVYFSTCLKRIPKGLELNGTIYILNDNVPDETEDIKWPDQIDSEKAKKTEAEWYLQENWKEVYDDEVVLTFRPIGRDYLIPYEEYKTNVSPKLPKVIESPVTE
ncbi:MAG TPA: hypothetical protein VN580_09385, partial [Clostridia bacterium]|nr:hypothetical protein [Clostridia bacterium]